MKPLIRAFIICSPAFLLQTLLHKGPRLTAGLFYYLLWKKNGQNGKKQSYSGHLCPLLLLLYGLSAIPFASGHRLHGKNQSSSITIQIALPGIGILCGLILLSAIPPASINGEGWVASAYTCCNETGHNTRRMVNLIHLYTSICKTGTGLVFQQYL